MRRLAVASFAFVLLLAGIWAASAGAPAGPAAQRDRATFRAVPACVDKPPCVYVTPDPELVPEGTVLTYHGQGWRPRKVVEATFGSYCPPDGFCAGVGLGKRFRAGSDGRFVFRFVEAPRRPAGVPGDVVAGGGPVEFEQWSRRPYRGTLIMRDAIPVPRPGSARDRADARAMRKAVFRLERSMERYAERTLSLNLRYESAFGRCRSIVNKERPERVAAVISAVLALGGDHVRLRLHRPALARFAATLEALQPADPELRAGAQAWVEQIRKPRYVPRPSVCAVLRQWRRTGYASPAAPVDPRALDLESDVEQDQRIAGATKRLRELGGGRSAAEYFSGYVLNYAVLINDDG
jgi:hypothetical protein